MNDGDSFNFTSDPASQIAFADIAEAVANLPTVPLLAIASGKSPLTRESSASEVLDMLLVLHSYLTHWLIPALELRINPAAGAALLRRPSIGIRVEGGRIEELMRAIATVRGG
jgi:hypothetical protein